MDAMDWLEDYERVKKSASSSKAKQANLAALDESLCKMERDPRGYDLSKAEVRRRRRLLDALRFAPESESPTAYATRAVESRIEEQEALMKGASPRARAPRRERRPPAPPQPKTAPSPRSAWASRPCTT